ncbi:MAG: hypothetical protein NZ902_06160 [Acidilobaceae archaeon]|nr:hypothetical protein [Acidilobaceae archaeon]MCX8166207.1 hypothetical protein [Acidilobaceae archaeon]MDW7974845.1 hypothetical protein [Sulfolobales archaeon]
MILAYIPSEPKGPGYEAAGASWTMSLADLARLPQKVQEFLHMVLL